MQSPFHSLLLRSKYINWAFLSLRTFPPVHAKILFHRLNIYFPRGPCLMCIQATGDQSISASFKCLSCPTFIPPAYTHPLTPSRHPAQAVCTLRGRENEDSTSCGTSRPTTRGQWPAVPRLGFARSSAWARSACRTRCRCSAVTPGVFWTPPEQAVHLVPLWEGPALPPVSAGFLWGIIEV